MTELEQRRRAMEKVRARHPEILDEARLKELAEQYLKREKQLMTCGLLLIPAAMYLLVLYRFDQKHLMLYCFLAMYVFTALAFLVSWLKKKRREASDAVKAPVTLSRKSLQDLTKSSRSSPWLPILIMLFLPLVWWMSWKNGNTDTLQTWLLICGIGSAVPWLLWFLSEKFKKKKNRQLADELVSGELRVVCNTVTDKEKVDTGVGDDVSYSYYLYFHKATDEGRRRLEVSQDEYKDAFLGEEYYLIYLNGRLLRSFSKSRYRLDMELTQLIDDDPDSVGETSFSDYEEYRKLETQYGAFAKRRWLKTHDSLPDGRGKKRR